MKTYNKGQVPEDSVCIETKTEPIEVDVPIIIHAKLQNADGRVISAVDPDAAMMSEQFPEDRVLVVYHNGMQEVVSVKQLVKETILSIKSEVKE